jgi:hypothetical protein
MEEEKHTSTEESGKDSTMYYIIGVLVLVLVLGVGYALRPKPAKTPTTTEPVTQTEQAAVPVPTIQRGPITDFNCDTQYYNTVIGLPQYYLTVEGVGKTASDKVTCKFTITQGKDTLAKKTIEGQLQQAPDLGGYTWRCTTEALELPANEPINVDVNVENSAKETKTCNAVYLLPTP